MKKNYIYMKKNYILIIMVFVLAIALVGCTQKPAADNNDKNNEGSNENKAASQVGMAYFSDDNTIIVMLNDLSNEKIENYKKCFSIEEFGDDTYESALFIPRYNGMKLVAYTTKFEGDELVKDELIDETTYTENYGFLLRYSRPETMPIIITIEGDGISEEYQYAMNGKDGTSEVEYIKKSK